MLERSKEEQCGKEVEELRKEMTESLRLRTAYNYLKQVLFLLNSLII